MTFEYRDIHGDVFQARPTLTPDGPCVVLETNLSIPVFVPLDRVEEIVTGIRDTARTASGQQPSPKPAYYGVNGCTCRAWTGVGGVPRFLRGDESVELISGWEEQPGCPHHKAAVGQPAEAQATDRAAVLREAADAVDAMSKGCSRRQPCASCNAREDAADALRRMAEEARS